jgi:hypothetical protein
MGQSKLIIAIIISTLILIGLIALLPGHEDMPPDQLSPPALDQPQ